MIGRWRRFSFLQHRNTEEWISEPKNMLKRSGKTWNSSNQSSSNNPITIYQVRYLLRLLGFRFPGLLDGATHEGNKSTEFCKIGRPELRLRARGSGEETAEVRNSLLAAPRRPWTSAQTPLFRQKASRSLHPPWTSAQTPLSGQKAQVGREDVSGLQTTPGSRNLFLEHSSP